MHFNIMSRIFKRMKKKKKKKTYVYSIKYMMRNKLLEHYLRVLLNEKLAFSDIWKIYLKALQNLLFKLLL